MQPTIVKTSKSDLCLLVVPDDANFIRVVNKGTLLCEYRKESEPGYSRTFKSVMPGSWQLIGPLKDITEEQAKELGFESVQAMKLWLQSKDISCICNPHGKERPQVTEPDPFSQYYASELYKQQLWDDAQIWLGNVILSKRTA